MPRFPTRSLARQDRLPGAVFHVQLAIDQAIHSLALGPNQVDHVDGFYLAILEPVLGQLIVIEALERVAPGLLEAVGHGLAETPQLISQTHGRLVGAGDDLTCILAHQARAPAISVMGGADQDDLRRGANEVFFAQPSRLAERGLGVGIEGLIDGRLHEFSRAERTPLLRIDGIQRIAQVGDLVIRHAAGRVVTERAIVARIAVVIHGLAKKTRRGRNAEPDQRIVELPRRACHEVEMGSTLDRALLGAVKQRHGTSLRCYCCGCRSKDPLSGESPRRVFVSHEVTDTSLPD